MKSLLNKQEMYPMQTTEINGTIFTIQVIHIFDQLFGKMSRFRKTILNKRMNIEIF